MLVCRARLYTVLCGTRYYAVYGIMRYTVLSGTWYIRYYAVHAIIRYTVCTVSCGTLHYAEHGILFIKTNFLA